MAELTGRIVLPGDPDYRDARTDYNTRFSKYPCVIVYCQRVRDVANAVKWAREHGVPVRARSGGHSYEAFSILDNGVVIDVSGMDRVYVDRKNGIATIEAGTALLPLYETLWREGVTIPGGTCPTVGIAGLALGGGFGMLTRRLGMLCDSLKAVQMVNAKGEIVYADESSNYDLLWASRGGGGGNFGIVTLLVFKVHPVSSVCVYDIAWNWQDAHKVIRAWQAWAPFVDERLTSILDLFTKEYGRVTSAGEFTGDESELRRLIRPLAAAGRPVSVKIRTLPYIEAVKKFSGGPGPHPFKNTGAFIYECLPDAAIDTLMRFMETSPGKENSIEFQSLGGGAGRIPPDGTAYFHRKALYNMQYITRWSAYNEGKPNILWVENLRQAMLRYTRGTYVNFPDVFVKDWPRAYYGENYPELQRIKRKYDPENVFRFNQSIRPA